MNITPSEIADIQEIGMLDGNKVSLIRTRGGFFIAAGKKRGKTLDEALSAGSHSAIVKYNLEKMYPTFQPTLMKSEASLSPAIVVKHSHFLSEDLKKSGHDIYSVQSGANIEFQITKQDIKIGSANATLRDNSVVVSYYLNIPQEFVPALAGATAEKALSCGTSSVKIQEK